MSLLKLARTPESVLPLTSADQHLNVKIYYCSLYTIIAVTFADIFRFRLHETDMKYEHNCLIEERAPGNEELTTNPDFIRSRFEVIDVKIKERNRRPRMSRKCDREDENEGSLKCLLCKNDFPSWGGYDGELKRTSVSEI